MISRRGRHAAIRRPSGARKLGDRRANRAGAERQSDLGELGGRLHRCRQDRKLILDRSLGGLRVWLLLQLRFRFRLRRGRCGRVRGRRSFGHTRAARLARRCRSPLLGGRLWGRLGGRWSRLGAGGRWNRLCGGRGPLGRGGCCRARSLRDGRAGRRERHVRRHGRARGAPLVATPLGSRPRQRAQDIGLSILAHALRIIAPTRRQGPGGLMLSRAEANLRTLLKRPGPIVVLSQETRRALGDP